MIIISVSKKIDFIATIQGNFDLEHLKNIHRFLFEDIYEWAGMERTIDLKKTQGLLGGQSVEYSTHDNISNDINSALQKMKNVNWFKLNDDKGIIIKCDESQLEEVKSVIQEEKTIIL